MKAKRTIWVIATTLVIAIVLGACSGSDSGDGGGGGDGAGTAEPGGQVVRESAELSTDGGASGDEAFAVGGQTLPGVGPAVIKTARLELEIPRDGVQDAVDEAISVAESSGGFVLSTTLANERDGRGTLVLRIPAERFESAMSALDDLGKVERRTVTGEDVTEEFVDLEARLRNFEAQEAVLLRLMDRAQSVADTIRVQRELTGIQLEVERIRGRLRFLEDQTTFGTITLELSESGVAAAKTTTIGKAWDRAGELALSLVSGLVISLGVVGPVVVLLVLGFLVFRTVRPRFSSN